MVRTSPRGHVEGLGGTSHEIARPYGSIHETDVSTLPRRQRATVASARHASSP